jgi:hypothetical protein
MPSVSPHRQYRSRLVCLDSKLRRKRTTRRRASFGDKTSRKREYLAVRRSAKCPPRLLACPAFECLEEILLYLKGNMLCRMDDHRYQQMSIAERARRFSEHGRGSGSYTRIIRLRVSSSSGCGDRISNMANVGDNTPLGNAPRRIGYNTHVPDMVIARPTDVGTKSRVGCRPFRCQARRSTRRFLLSFLPRSVPAGILLLLYPLAFIMLRGLRKRL